MGDAGNGCLGLHDLIALSLDLQTFTETKPTTTAMIYMTGGSSLFPLLDERLQQELKATLPSGTHFKVAHCGDKKEKNQAWLGALLWFTNQPAGIPAFLSKKQHSKTAIDDTHFLGLTHQFILW